MRGNTLLNSPPVNLPFSTESWQTKRFAFSKQQSGPASLDLPRPHLAQQQIIREAKRFNVLACGRRFGKTLLGIELASSVANEGYPVAWFAPTYKLLEAAWRDACEMLHPVITGKSVQQHRLEIGRGSIEMWSLDSPDSARGRKYKRVIIDEAAMIPSFEAAWSGAIRPTLADERGDAYWLSTPKGMNFFKHGFDKGQDPLQLKWASWQFPSSANPHLDPEEIEEARQTEPELWFKQEWLAEFLQSEGAVFRNIEPNLKAKEPTPKAHEGHRIVSGLDWAQKHDFTAHSIGCADCKTELELDRFNKIEWAFQREKIKTAIDKWKIKEVLAEENSIGSPNIEALQKEGLPVKGFQTTAQSKSPLIQSLALAFERNEFKWLNIPVATAELVAYESKVSAITGRVTYSAPEGMNDDTVIARALMNHAATNRREWVMY